MMRKSSSSYVDKDLLVEMVSDLVESMEAAEIIGVTQTSIKRYVDSGELFGVKIGRGLYCLKSECKKFIPKPPGRPRKES